jgi:hypothetical protein
MGNENEIILTVRVIKSFPHRNVKNILVRIDASTTTLPILFGLIQEQIRKIPQLTATVQKYDSLKLYYQPHGTKTQHLVINFDDDEGKVFWGPGVTRNEIQAGEYIKYTMYTLQFDIIRH